MITEHVRIIVREELTAILTSMFGAVELPESAPLSPKEAAADIHSEITSILKSVGIPSSIKGFGYLRLAIAMVYNKPKSINAMTKGIYPDIAKACDTTASRVERAMRHATEVMFAKGDDTALEELFGTFKTKTTNSEFIATVADQLRIDHKL